VIARHDYHPFGEEIVTSQRTASLGYAEDMVRKQFTGYERDGEIELDFAEARYYSFDKGRFNTTDPLLSTGEPMEPQTWNRYTYALNSPLSYLDPTGMYVCKGETEQCKQFATRLAEAKGNLEKIKKTYGENSTQFKKALAAVNSYGEDETGKKNNNGVVITFNRKESGAKTSASFDANGKLTGNVVVNFNKDALGSDSSQALVAHEGSHVDGYKSVGNRSDYSEETDAHVIQSIFLEAQFPDQRRFFTVTTPGKPPTKRSAGVPATTTEYDIWNPSWNAADKETLRSNAVKEYIGVPKSKGGKYGLTPPIPKPAPARRKK